MNHFLVRLLPTWILATALLPADVRPWTLSYQPFSRAGIINRETLSSSRKNRAPSQSRGRNQMSLFSTEQPLASRAASLSFDSSVWTQYEEIMTENMCRDRVLGPRKRRPSADEVKRVQRFLLQKETLPIVDFSNKDKDGNANLRSRIKIQRERFLRSTIFTDKGYEFCSRCLVYTVHLSAKRQTPLPCLVVWEKVKEMGLIPNENAVSTFMFLLASNEQETVQSPRDVLQCESCFELATFHQLLFKPTEKTVLLSVKSLVAKGDLLKAERVLSDSGTSGGDDTMLVKRLRTYLPVLEHYCDVGDIVSALRVYRSMKNSPGVYFDADSYGLILGAAARHGWFQPVWDDDKKGQLSELNQYGFPVVNGAGLFDILMAEMAEDLLEIDGKTAETLVSNFQKGSSSESQADSCTFVERVTIPPNGTCPKTGVQLRLFCLSEIQKQRVRNTLSEMATEKHMEFRNRLEETYKKYGNEKALNEIGKMSADFASKELAKFSEWLRCRDEEAFTCFVDGANVAFYGHGQVHWSQVKLVVNKLEEMGENVLVIIPRKYVRKDFWVSGIKRRQYLSLEDLACIRSLVESKKLFIVESLLYDDYYWMISSVLNQNSSKSLYVEPGNLAGRIPGMRPMLVTNDQMRDHRFSLMEPRDFRRWTGSHIVDYKIANFEEGDEEWDERPVSFVPADYYSREIQGNEGNFNGNSTVWHFPVSDWNSDEYLCISIPR